MFRLTLLQAYPSPLDESGRSLELDTYMEV